MKNLSTLKYLIPILLAMVVLVTCRRNYSKPGTEYMPDMVHSLAYETYTKPKKDNSVTLFQDGQTALVPPKGSIPAGFVPYDLPNTAQGYAQASSRLVNPIAGTEANLARGKQIYTIHCSPCHGKKGDGEGSAVVASDYKLAKPPINFTAPSPGYLTPGRMFHTITYGKGMMGSYASQVSQEDRWKVIHYINSLNKSQPVVVSSETTSETK